MRILPLFLLLCLPVSVYAAPTQADLRQLEQQIRAEQQSATLNARKAEELSGEVRNVQKQMIQLARTVQEREEDLTRLENRQIQMQAREKELERNLSLTNRQMVQIATGLQMLAIRPPELALMEVQTPLNTLRSRMLMGYGLPVVQGTNRQIRSDLAELSRLKADLQEQIVQMRFAQSQLSEQSAQMDRLLQQKAMLQAQYQVSHTQSREKVKTLGAQAKDLKDLLDRLEKEKAARIAKQKALQQQQQQQQRIVQSAPVPTQAPMPVSAPLSGHFAKAKGRLPYPIRGTIIGRFGDTTLGGAHSKGITIAGRSSARVVAPFDGTVLFAGPFKNYGQVIILDHGDSYLTLLAGMEAVNPSVGQTVLAGEPIGQMKIAKAELYIEIRHEGQVLDPTGWFKE